MTQMLIRLALVLGVFHGAALTDEATAAQASAPATVETAKALMLQGRREEAKSLLEELARERPSSNDVAFLLGLLAIDSTDYRQAIGYFRAILIREPAAYRVRLELGRAFYLSHDYENAYRQFQFARAGKLPPGVGASIDKFLTAIRREKNWSYSLGVAIAPDTNINNGTSLRETEIFGLPFELSKDTRRRSGTGLALSGSGEFAPRINDVVRVRLGFSLERRQYKANAFDDMTIAAYVGPRLLLGDWDLSVLSTGFSRTFRAHRLSEGAGVRIEAVHGLGVRTALSFAVARQAIRYPHYSLEDGGSYTATIGVIRALTAATLINARIGASHHSARAPELASSSAWLSAGYYRDLAGGFSIYVEPSYALSRYEGSDPFFGRRRRDSLVQAQVALLNRRIVFSRFTPRIALTIARRFSTIELYKFTQRRLEIGLTSSF